MERSRPVKWFHEGVTFDIALDVRPCPNCDTLVHTLSVPDAGLGPLCPSCHPAWQHAPFMGQRPEDVARAEWQQRLKDRKLKAAEERRQAAQEEADNR